MPPTFDIWDQAVLTQLVLDPVETALEATNPLGRQIAPFEDLEGRMASMEVGNTYSFGIGQFKAPNAMPPLVEMPTKDRQFALIELAQLEELHRINSEQWMRLRSDHEPTRRAEGLEIVDRGRVLQLRNERLTEWMTWQALSGSLTITYPRTNSQIFIDYGFLPGHKPSAAINWTDLNNSDPVADIEAWQQQVANDSGQMGTRIHLTSQTAKLILDNAKLKTYYNVPAGQPFRATLENVQQLLAEGTEFVIYDAGYRPMASGAARNEAAHTRYLAHNRVLITTPYTIDGERIAETLDGQVDVSVAYNEAEPRQGAQSELILDHMTKNRYMRQASARIPRVLHPEAILWATVGA